MYKKRLYVCYDLPECAVCLLYVLYVCYDLPRMCCMCAMICQDVCCMCAMICQDLCVCQYVCHPIAVSVPKPQESRKSARIQEKCQNPRNPRNPTKSTKSDEIQGIQQNRPFIIDHFIRHYTLQMTGKVGDRFWDFGV